MNNLVKDHSVIKKICMRVRRFSVRMARKIPTVNAILLGRDLSCQYWNKVNGYSRMTFIREHFSELHAEKIRRSKGQQIKRLLQKVSVMPVEGNMFFYSVDPFKTVMLAKPIFDNYSIDYSEVINSSLQEIAKKLRIRNSLFDKELLAMIDGLHQYLKRCRNNKDLVNKYEKQIDAMESLFHRPAQTFFEGLQRILFVNQFLWQTRHKGVGLGHLDWLLYDLYRSDLQSGTITEEDGLDMLCDFMKALHEHCWFKSSMLMGDTGQIIILGGLSPDGSYRCNTLSYEFIKASKKLRLPDPKVLLRCSGQMPEDLLDLAIDCIATGIGAPLLSNDDAVIPALIDFGYQEDAYQYSTAACWEPLIAGLSCDQNNMCSINFAQPLVAMMDSPEFEELDSMEDILSCYKKHLQSYLKGILTELSQIEFEEDPMLSLFSPVAREAGKDLLRGGAKYAHMGLTSVGMGTVVNSLLNIRRYVLEKGQFTLEALNRMRKCNFDGEEKILQTLKACSPGYGSDAPEVIELTKNICNLTSEEMEKYTTKLGGKFKFGLSSPGYVSCARETPATLDGRKNGDPFSVHISSSSALPPTELMRFAMQLDYRANRINGNVVDFFVTPNALSADKQKYKALIQGAFAGGVYQMQFNVVDSATLIAAKENPDLFPDLVVRVWGFSAYFKDLPDEYKDLLISRAQENEIAA